MNFWLDFGSAQIRKTLTCEGQRERPSHTPTGLFRFFAVPDRRRREGKDNPPDFGLDVERLV